MIAPIISKSTGSTQDCRRGCAEWSNSFWRLSGPKHTVRISCVYDESCVYDHPRTRKVVPKENIIDNVPRATTDVKTGGFSPELGYEATMVIDAPARYSDEDMHT